ncbi:MAG: DedA family protein, partial [Gemmatimonadota bacterium]
MELLRQFVDFFLHLDTHLAEIIADYGTWTYAILFLIIFVETGLVIMPLLPGDSLLFAAGTFAALGSLNPLLLIALLATAAILGDTVNYWIGKRIGARAFSGNIRFLKRSYLDRTQRFYERHGGKTIILARFVPIVRTFAPFVAGVGTMTYPRFLAYNVVGAVAWVSGFVGIGYLFGNIPAVKERFSLVILG